MLALAAVGGAVVGFGIARSVAYERWVRDRRDRAAIAQRQRINDHFNQTRRVHVGHSEPLVSTPDQQTGSGRPETDSV
jgi:hypothetical protein